MASRVRTPVFSESSAIVFPQSTGMCSSVHASCRQPDESTSLSDWFLYLSSFHPVTSTLSSASQPLRNPPVDVQPRWLTADATSPDDMSSAHRLHQYSAVDDRQCGSSDVHITSLTSSKSLQNLHDVITRRPHSSQRSAASQRLPQAAAASASANSTSGSTVSRPHASRRAADCDVTAARRIRYEYNCLQRQMLRESYEKCKTPTDRQLDELVAELKNVFGADRRLDKSNVRVWFQNRRREDRQRQQTAGRRDVITQSSSSSTSSDIVLAAVKRLAYICF